MSDSRVNLNDVTSGVDDVGDPGCAVSGGNITGDRIARAHGTENERSFRVEDAFGFEHSSSSRVVARDGAIDEPKLSSGAFEW